MTNTHDWIEKFVDGAWTRAVGDRPDDAKDAADRMYNDGFYCALHGAFLATFGRQPTDTEKDITRLMLGRRQHEYLLVRGKDPLGFWYDESCYPAHLIRIEKRLRKVGINVQLVHCSTPHVGFAPV